MDSLFLGYVAKQDSLCAIFQDAMARRAPDTRVEVLIPGNEFAASLVIIGHRVVMPELHGPVVEVAAMSEVSAITSMAAASAVKQAGNNDVTAAAHSPVDVQHSDEGTVWFMVPCSR